MSRLATCFSDPEIYFLLDKAVEMFQKVENCYGCINLHSVQKTINTRALSQSNCRISYSHMIIVKIDLVLQVLLPASKILIKSSLSTWLNVVFTAKMFSYALSMKWLGDGSSSQVQRIFICLVQLQQSYASIACIYFFVDMKMQMKMHFDREYLLNELLDFHFIIGKCYCDISECLL